MAKRFGGFIVATEPSVPLPLSFFTEVLPQITEIAELHVTLAAFRLVHQAGGLDSPVPERAIVRDRLL
ncbi:MAG: primosomal replication protein N, partial [Chloroflexota bacterium]